MTRPRRLGRTILAASVALSGLLTPSTGLERPAGPSTVAAATPDLTIVADTTYDVRPDDAAVAITAELTLANRLKDTATRRYYFDRAFLAVLPGTTGFAISSSTKGFKPKVRVSGRNDDHQLLAIDFGGQLGAGKTARFQLRFVLPDPGGAADRDVRVGQSLVSFPVWAFGSESTPGGSVRVVFPAGFAVRLESGDLGPQEVADDGSIVFASGSLAAPLDFFAYLSADRPGAYLTSTIGLDLAGSRRWLSIRGWPDDRPWSDRMIGLLGAAVPRMSEAIGIDWPQGDTLAIEESVIRPGAGYAGRFDPVRGVVEVAYQAPDLVVLHEASHAWFNGGLLADRWANEGFAELYARRAAESLGLTVDLPEMRPAAREARIPLNAWPAADAGAAGTAAGAAAEAAADELSTEYAYAASLVLAEAIAREAGDDALRDVWQDVAAGVAAYQPVALQGDTVEGTTLPAVPGAPEPTPDGAPAPEPAAGPPDWRGLLDLLEDRTGGRYDGLWRAWVVRPDEVGLLADRRAARELYEATLAELGDWRLPATVREALRAWQFAEATDLLLDARTVLAYRAELQDAAATAGLSLPRTLRQAFETDGTFGRATTEATAELAAVDAIQLARASRILDPDLLERIGLVGADPDDDLADAQRAFATGDMTAAVRESAAARWTSLTALETGRRRALSLVAIAAGVLLSLLVVIGRWRGRQFRRAHRLRLRRARAADDLDGRDAPDARGPSPTAPPAG